METGGALREEEREARGSVFGEYRHSFFFLGLCFGGCGVGFGLVWFSFLTRGQSEREIDCCWGLKVVVTLSGSIGI